MLMKTKCKLWKICLMNRKIRYQKISILIWNQVVRSMLQLSPRNTGKLYFEEKVKVINYWVLPGIPKNKNKKFNHKYMKPTFTWLTNKHQLYNKNKSEKYEQTCRDKMKEVNKTTFQEFLHRQSWNEIVRQ